MPKTRRSDEPFCEPSVEASTVVSRGQTLSGIALVQYQKGSSPARLLSLRQREGTVSVYRNRRHTRLYIVYTQMYPYLHDVHFSFLSCDMLCVDLFRMAPSAAIYAGSKMPPVTDTA